MSTLRTDPVTGRLVIVAPERRRWARRTPPPRPGPDACPFCEGQEALAGREILAWRPAGSPANGPGWRVRVVANRVPALRVENQLGVAQPGLLQSLGGLGAHEVIIESPDHDASWATQTAGDVGMVLWAWRERLRDLRRDDRLRAWLVVKDVGLDGGAPAHAHSQLLALPMPPPHQASEVARASAHRAATGRCLTCETLDAERAAGQRVIEDDGTAVLVAPFASRVPFETWLLPRAHQSAFDEVADDQLAAIAAMLQRLAVRLQTTLETPPHTVRLHTMPVGEDAAACHWRLEILPRVVPESGLAWDGGVPINTVPPEEAARVLRSP